MATTIVNPSKWAKIAGQAAAGVGGFTTARTTGNSVQNNSTVDSSIAIKYGATSGRGSTTHSFIRSYYYFDISGVSDLANLTSAAVDIPGYVNASSKVIIVSSSAFGGDGSSNATTGEFFTSIDYAQPYTDTNGQLWVTGTNSFDLDTNPVITYLKSEPDAFIFTIVDFNNDYGNSAGSPTIQNFEGISFSGHASNVELTLITDSSNIDKINRIAVANIDQWGGTSFSNVASINGVT